MSIFGNLDTYSLKARVYPALLALIPPIIIGAVWLSPYATRFKSLGILICTCGGLFVLANISRSLGKKLEQKLLIKWGGWQTTKLLRHRDSQLDLHSKNRYKNTLEAHLENLKFPTADEERTNPSEADAIYSTAISYLIEKTRDPKSFSILLNENIHYGFWRNLLGLKPIALAILMGSLGFHLFMVFQTEGITEISTINLVLILILISNTTLWLLLVKEKSVERAGYIYAKQLLKSSDQIIPESKKK